MSATPAYEPAGVLAELRARFPGVALTEQPTADGIPTGWVAADEAKPMLAYLKNEASLPFASLYDLGAVDERSRTHRDGLPAAGFSVFYHLVSYARNADLRLKVALPAERPQVQTITDLWPAADWYEREVWDMFGIDIAGHPNLRRILMPPWWEGHPLRKEAPSRATELGPFSLPAELVDVWQDQLRFDPADWGLPGPDDDPTLMYLNVGPQHGATHGPLRIVVGLRDEEIVACIPDIGYHHRGAEKMGERQSWHTYIPYTDRVDYLGGVINNMAYLEAVEQLAGITVPDRAKVIRVMLSEIFRISNHLVYYGTFAQDMGALSPVFYMFTDRERIFEIVEAICGARMHPGWFRIGGVAQDLPQGWDGPIRKYVAYQRKRLKEYDAMVMGNRILKARTQGVGDYTTAEAIEWGVTGPGLRATGFEWDFRKKRPYSGYERFEFDIPTATHGDCYDRAVVRVEEMRQSLRIVEQCVENMPAGPYKADHPLTTPPPKERTMHDIETLITHFLGVSWGPVIPPGEAFVGIEATKGNNGYYLISDGSTVSYRTRVRTPSFPHIQMLPELCRGLTVPDLLAILGSIDFVLADVDR